MGSVNYGLSSNGSSATATDFIGGFEPSKAIDGSMGTYYHSLTQTSGNELVIDLGQDRDIDSVKTHATRTDSGYDFSFKVETSSNGSSWTERLASSAASTSPSLQTFASVVTCRYVKLVATNAKYITVTEFEIWGDPPAPPTCDVAEYTFTPQDAFGILGTIGDCESASYTFSPQDIDGFITEAPPDFATLWTSTFVEERSRYFVNAPDFEAVTRNHEYEDGGKSFNELSDNAPQTWEIVFKNKTPEWAAILDQHFALYRFSRVFNFLAKDGEVYQVYYKEYAPNHEAHKSWLQERRVVLIKYP